MPARYAWKAVARGRLRVEINGGGLLPRSLLASMALVSIAACVPAQAAAAKTFSGRLELFHTDRSDGRPDTYRYELHTKAGTYYVLHFERDVRLPRPGRRVRLRGLRHGHRIAVKRVIDVSAHSAAAVTQAKKLAVILVNFQDNKSEPYTPEQVRQIIWTGTTSVRAYFSEASFGQLELGSKLNPNGDVYGYYTIPYNEANSTCPNRTWGEAAMTAAHNAGVDLSGYTNIVFLWPEAPCGWAGSAYVDGMYSYMNGQLGSSMESSNLNWGRLAIHELGHNFGLYHAHSLLCHDAAGNAIAYNPDESYCRLEEYGDPYDPMGSGDHHDFNDYYKGVLGWWATNAVQTATTTGTYFLQPQETLGGGVQVLRVIKQTYSSGDHQYYYLEFRQPSLFDNWNTFNVEVTEGVSIRLAGEFSDASGSELLDMNPPAPAEGLNLQSNAPLMPGETYTDPTTGTAITTNSTSPLGASVTIAFPGSGGGISPPTVSITAPTGGETVSGSATISASASANVGVSSVTLAVDNTTVATLTSAPYSTSWNTTTIANGTHTIIATAKDAAGNSASSSVTVSVSNAVDTSPPTVPSGLSVTALSASQTALSWKPSSDDMAVTAYDIFRNGTYLTTVTGTRFADSGLATATASSYQVRARDGAGNVSGLSSVVKATTTQTKTAGALSGWVTSSATGLPLNGAKVTATLNGHSWSAKTNASGFYLLSNLTPATYSVAITENGYTTQTTTLAVIANAATIDTVAL
jgi:Big-like domain-containing protein/carboxypeptidase family protein/gametolysin peptidase M11